MNAATYVITALLGLILVKFAAAAEPFSSTGITKTLRFFMELDSNDDDRVSEREYVGDKGGRSRATARKQFRRVSFPERPCTEGRQRETLERKSWFSFQWMVCFV